MPRIFLSPPDLTPRDFESVEQVLASNWVAPVGPHLNEFEGAICERTGVSHALALSSGTAALHLALQVIGVGPGDAVVCPSFTFAASANPICYLGAEPVFVDSEPRTWNMDSVLLEKALYDRKDIKAVIVVHLYGQCAEMIPIRELCDEYGVVLIEDAAEALGSSYRGAAAGSLGDLSFFSFNGNKIITTSGGGMLLSENDGWIARARHLSTQAREPAIHYEHKDIGYNYRMSNLLAGLGCSQLSDLDRRISRKREHFVAYSKAFEAVEEIEMMPIAELEGANYWLTCITLEESLGAGARDDLVRALEGRDIEARPLWKPMHLQPVFEGRSVYGGEVCADLFERGICLPSGAAMTNAQRADVIEVVLGCVEGIRVG